MDPNRPSYPTAEQEKWAQSQARSAQQAQSNAPPAAYAPPPSYDPSTYGAHNHQQDGRGGTLVLFDMENGNQVGELGERIQVSGVAPGSQGWWAGHHSTMTFSCPELIHFIQNLWRSTSAGRTEL